MLVPVEVELAETGLALRAAWAGEGRVEEVERVLEAVPQPWPADVVAIARHFTPTSRRLLTERGANWADEAGGARIVGGRVVVLREGSHEPPGRRTQFSWSASAASIAEALLAAEWSDGFGTSEVAHATQWSPPQVSEVLASFDAKGWTEKRGPRRGPGARRALIDAEGLLEAWAEHVTSEVPERRVAHGATDDVLEFLRTTLSPSLDERVRWAVTGWAGSELLAPIMTGIPTLQIYVAQEEFFGPLSSSIEETGLVELDGGAVEFWAAPARAISLGGRREGLRVASAPRVYADLLRLGDRGEYAAAHLKSEVLARSFRPFSARPASPALRTWRDASGARFEDRVARSTRPNLYRNGTWSLAYRLDGSREPDLREFLEVLRRSTGRETGWPAFSLNIVTPEVFDGVFEAWIASKTFADASHSDFWRADPAGQMFLARGYDEDGAIEDIQPGSAIELTLPVWRIGECVLHAQRLGAELEATSVEFLATWRGIRGRQLQTRLNPARFLGPTGRPDQDEVTSSVLTRLAAIDDFLPGIVRSLVDPLYAAFGLLDVSDVLYAEELEKLRSPV